MKGIALHYCVRTPLVSPSSYSVYNRLSEILLDLHLHNTCILIFTLTIVVELKWFLKTQSILRVGLLLFLFFPCTLTDFSSHHTHHISKTLIYRLEQFSQHRHPYALIGTSSSHMVWNSSIVDTIVTFNNWIALLDYLLPKLRTPSTGIHEEDLGDFSNSIMPDKRQPNLLP